MNLLAANYILYLIISVMLTIWIAHILHTNGRIFLVDAFRGNEAMADSVNRLLVVGFYLINIGFITLALRYGEAPTTTAESIEYLSTKIGLVLVVLGVMHFFNMFNFNKMRKKGLRPRATVEAPPANPPATATPPNT